jgi:hypothetical protein
MAETDIEKLATEWNSSEGPVDISGDFFCGTQNVFQARLDNMVRVLLAKKLNEGDVYVVSAIAGEIGNNSFDHNIGNWPDVRGIFFGCRAEEGHELKIILADRGQGVMKTLKRVRPEIENDEAALKAAFFERISGRAPESRGNGLKFVRENIKDRKMHLTFASGEAVAELNQDFNIRWLDKKIHGCFAVIKMKI